MCPPTTRHVNGPKYRRPIAHDSCDSLGTIAQRRQLLFELLHLPSETCGQVA
jgi:hypothetical protein